MTRDFLSRPARRTHDPAAPTFTLADLVAALCAGCVPAQGLDLLLNRVEGHR